MGVLNFFLSFSFFPYVEFNIHLCPHGEHKAGLARNKMRVSYNSHIHIYLDPYTTLREIIQ